MVLLIFFILTHVYLYAHLPCRIKDPTWKLLPERPMMILCAGRYKSAYSSDNTLLCFLVTISVRLIRQFVHYSVNFNFLCRLIEDKNSINSIKKKLKKKGLKIKQMTFECLSYQFFFFFLRRACVTSFLFVTPQFEWYWSAGCSRMVEIYYKLAHFNEGYTHSWRW